MSNIFACQVQTYIAQYFLSETSEVAGKKLHYSNACTNQPRGSACHKLPEIPGQRRSSVAGLTEDDRQTVDKERQVGDPMQLRTEVLNL